VALPGFVTIPAGRYSARITIVPIDDTEPEGIETVVLGLILPPTPTGSAQPYELGFSSKAGAIILDNDTPPPPCLRLLDGLFHVCLPGTNGFSFRLDTSSDLVNWAACCSDLLPDAAIHFLDPDAADFKVRFYRAVPQPMLILEE
jgi:hypothetical protein